MNAFKHNSYFEYIQRPAAREVLRHTHVFVLVM